MNDTVFKLLLNYVFQIIVSSFGFALYACFLAHIYYQQHLSSVFNPFVAVRGTSWASNWALALASAKLSRAYPQKSESLGLMFTYFSSREIWPVSVLHYSICRETIGISIKFHMRFYLCHSFPTFLSQLTAFCSMFDQGTVYPTKRGRDNRMICFQKCLGLSKIRLCHLGVREKLCLVSLL